MSGVKVTNERPARPIPDAESTTGTDDGDDNESWDPDTTTGIPPGTDPGDVLTWDGDSWEPEPPAVAGNFELKNEGGQSFIEPHGAMGTTETFDPTDGNVHTGTLDDNCTFTLGAPVGSGACLLELRIAGDGTNTWTWPGSVVWVGGVTPDPPEDGETLIVIVETLDGGTTWIGAVVGAGSSAAAITIKDEGSDLTAAPTSIDFVGAGVTATAVGDDVTVTIPGGGATTLDGLSDVTITSVANADRLRYDSGSSLWKNSNLVWEPMIASDGTVMTDGLLNPMQHEVPY